MHLDVTDDLIVIAQSLGRSLWASPCDSDKKIEWTIEREMFAEIAPTGTVDEKLLIIGIYSSRTCNDEYIPIGVGKVSSLISPVAHSKRT